MGLLCLTFLSPPDALGIWVLSKKSLYLSLGQGVRKLYSWLRVGYAVGWGGQRLDCGQESCKTC